jgi:hypothetical protein
MSKKNFEGKVRDEIIDELMSNAADFYRGKEKELGKKFLDSDQLAGIEYIFKKNIIRMDIWNLVKYFGRFCADVVSGDIKNVDEHRLELLNSLGASKKDIGGNKYPEATATFVSTKFHNVIQNEYGEIVKCFDDNKKEISEDFMKIVKIAFNNEPVDIELINEIKKTRMGFVELKSLRLNDCDVDNESINTLMFHLSSLDFLIEELRLGYKNTILEETGRDFYSVNELLNSNVSIGEIIDSLKKFDILKDENICSKDDVVEYFREKNELDLLEIQTAEMSESEEDSQVWMKTFDFEGDVCFVPIKDKVCFSAGLKGLNISKETLLPALDFGDAENREIFFWHLSEDFRGLCDKEKIYTNLKKKNISEFSMNEYLIEACYDDIEEFWEFMLEDFDEDSDEDFDELFLQEEKFTNPKKKNSGKFLGGKETLGMFGAIRNLMHGNKNQSPEEKELLDDGGAKPFNPRIRPKSDKVMDKYRQELMYDLMKTRYRGYLFFPLTIERDEIDYIIDELDEIEPETEITENGFQYKNQDEDTTYLAKEIIEYRLDESDLFEKAYKEYLKSVIQGKGYIKREDLIDEIVEFQLFFQSKWYLSPDSFLYDELCLKSEEELKEIRARLDNLINMHPPSEKQEHKATRIDLPNN